MIEKLNEKILRNLALVWEITINDFKLKYRGSIIGYLWSLLNPFLMLLTLYFVFRIVVRIEIENYPLFLLLGIILWNFFSSTTTTSIDSINQKSSLFKKISFSKSTIVFSSVLLSIINLLFNLTVLFGFLLFFRIKISFSILLFTIPLLELIFFSIGISFYLIIFYAKFRDVFHIWSFLLLIGFWLSPIFYSPSRIPLEFRRFYMLNPIARIITDSRNILLYGYIPDLKQMLITFIFCFAVFVFGYYFFKRNSQVLNEAF
ncbi:MAG: ABC transporter permease [Thermoplasmatota archaeon]|jgi:ABC-type polysaccharide/polyol phosphate export permease